MYNIIDKKIKGQELERSEIEFFVRGVVSGEVLPEQAGALLSAICINGMTKQETLWLTLAMSASGTTFLLGDSGISVDKHSSGGVGDTVTLIVAPILAEAGLKVAKLSGRGLGHTGGTVDKLESFKGFNVMLSSAQFLQQLKTGIVVCGQSDDIVPADKILYAMRDKTATVRSIPLITASIMSKKLAIGADILVFDIKYGNGAFMKTLDDARLLAQEIVDVGKSAGKKTSAIVSCMNQPLSRHLGCNAEVNEAIRVLKGKKCRLASLSVQIAQTAIDMAGVNQNAGQILDSGKAFNRFVRLIEGQGGTFTSQLEEEPNSVFVTADRAGYVNYINTERLGFFVQQLNRSSKAWGAEVLVRLGDAVSKGQPLLRVFAKTINIEELNGIFTVGSSQIEHPPLIAQIIT